MLRLHKIADFSRVLRILTRAAISQNHSDQRLPPNRGARVFAASRLEEIVARKSACAACSCVCCVYIKSANFRACCEFLPALRLAKITAISICRKIAAHRCYFARAVISQNRTVNAFSTRRNSMHSQFGTARLAIFVSKAELPGYIGMLLSDIFSKKPISCLYTHW